MSLHSLTLTHSLALSLAHSLIYSLTNASFLYSIVAYTYPFVRDASDYELSESSVAVYNVTCYTDYYGSTNCDTNDIDIVNGSGCNDYGGQAIVSCGKCLAYRPGL